jgi:hypothetical protein
MKTIAKLSFAIPVALLLSAGHAHAAFKCQGADGKIEYSDRPCDTTKNTLDKPNANKGVLSRPIGNPMEQLQKLFGDYEPRLCERELLAAELDRANRSGELTKSPAAWRPKQDKLIELNEVMVDFQLRAGKITKAAGNDSAETAALRKFQAGLKTCEQKIAAPSTPATPASSAMPTAAPPAAPAPSKPAAK